MLLPGVGGVVESRELVRSKDSTGIFGEDVDPLLKIEKNKHKHLDKINSKI